MPGDRQETDADGGEAQRRKVSRPCRAGWAEVSPAALTERHEVFFHPWSVRSSHYCMVAQDTFKGEGRSVANNTEHWWLRKEMVMIGPIRVMEGRGGGPSCSLEVGSVRTP